MAPFPETEIMTIKRLEVALRKLDYKLLKDGAYKLHEKYHSGFKFEYLDLLKEILSTIEATPSIPKEIRNILVPTIEDILTSTPIEPEENEEAPEQNRVSSLTSLSYSTKKEPDLKLQVEMQKNIQSPFSAEPFREFSTPKVVVNKPAPAAEIVEAEPTEAVEEIKENIKKIAVCYYDNKTPQLFKYNENSVVKDLAVQTDFDDLSKIDLILKRLTDKKSSACVITNSINPKLSTIKEAKLIPIFGLLNFFKCQKCAFTHLNSDLSITALALQCPKCGGVMLLDNEFNLDNYNEANISLVEADIWVLINPNAENKMTFEMIKAALKMNKTLEEIYILDDNISIKENYKNALYSIKADLKISTNNNDIEEFFNSID